MQESSAAPSTQSQPTSVQGVEPIQKFNAEGPTSWDDLEKLTMPSSKAEASEKKSPKESKETKAGKEKDHGNESKNKEKSEKVKDSKEDALASTNSPSKLIKVKDGDQELELKSDLPITVKVDGKTTTVPLQELLNNYSGQASLTKKFQEFQSERKKFDSDRGRLQEGVKAIQELAEASDPRSAIYKLAEWSGQDGESMYKEFVTKLEQKLAELQGLSPEERRVKELEEKLSFKERRELESKQKQESEKLEREFIASVKEVTTKTGLTQAEFADLFEEYQKLSGKKTEEIEPKDVGEYFEKLVLDHRVRGILKDVGVDDAEVGEAHQFMMETARKHKDLSEEDLRAIALEGYGKETAKRLSRKVKKMESQGGEKRVARDPQKSPLFFDDLS